MSDELVKTILKPINDRIENSRPRRRLVLAVGVLGTLVFAGGWALLPPEITVPVIHGVFSEPTQTISIRGYVDERVERKEPQVDIREVNTRHKTIGTNTQSYTRSFAADEGFRIVELKWTMQSEARVSNFHYGIEGGGSQAVVRFNLKSGPVTDRYRGWLHGTLVMVQEKVHPAQTVELLMATPVKEGQLFSFADKLDRFSRIEVLGESGELLGSLGTSMTVSLPGSGLQVRFGGQDGNGSPAFAATVEPAPVSKFSWVPWVRTPDPAVVARN